MPPTFKKCSCSYFQNYNLRNWLNCSSGYLPRAPVWGRWICRIFGAIHHREERQKSGSTGKSQFKGTFINDVTLICVTSFMNDPEVEHRQNMFFLPSSLLLVFSPFHPWIGVLLDESDCLLLIWWACSHGHIWTELNWIHFANFAW